MALQPTFTATQTTHGATTPASDLPQESFLAATESPVASSSIVQSVNRSNELARAASYLGAASGSSNEPRWAPNGSWRLKSSGFLRNITRMDNATESTPVRKE